MRRNKKTPASEGEEENEEKSRGNKWVAILKVV